MSSGETMHTLSGASQFPTTRWTLVVAAGDPRRKEARSALVSLCENYWYPLYAYLRRRGHPSDQAQDLTQEFFTRVLEGRYLDRADPEKGRFRSFLLSSLKFFVADEEDRQRAHKRGGGQLVSLEFSSGEERYQREPSHDETPEQSFRTALGAFGARPGRGEIAGRVRSTRPAGAFRAVENVPPRPVRCAICGTGARNEHVGRSAQSGNSQIPEEISRTLPPGNRGHRGRSGGSGIRTPVFGGRAQCEIAAIGAVFRLLFQEMRQAKLPFRRDIYQTRGYRRSC